MSILPHPLFITVFSSCKIQVATAASPRADESIVCDLLKTGGERRLLLEMTGCLGLANFEEVCFFFILKEKSACQGKEVVKEYTLAVLLLSSGQ